MNNYEFCATYIRDLKTPKTVLDFGCGSGQIVTKLLEFGIDAKGCDIFYEGGDVSKDVSPMLFGKIIKPMVDGLIPFSDESFDLIVSNQVLEHVGDIDSALSEFHRVLKPGGLVLTLVPDSGVWRENHTGIPFLHWFPRGSKFRIYYAACLRAIGFGYFKETGSFLKWAEEKSDWLDKWVYYRSPKEIRAAFERLFENMTPIEDNWLRYRLGSRGKYVSWLPKRWVCLFVRKLGGLVFVSFKREASTPCE